MTRTALSVGFLLLSFIVTHAQGLNHTVLDFDGDRKTDYAVVREASGGFDWYLQQSTEGLAAQTWGLSGIDVLVPADYDGDSRCDFAIWRFGTPANFYILQSSNGTLKVVTFGSTGDDPRITQDFDGDGKADPAVTRNAGGTLTWYILRSSLGFTSAAFGNNHDASIRGDFDGDGMADIAVYRRSSGSPANTFFALRSSDGGVQVATFGVSETDFVVPGDFDGDSKTDYAVWRATGTETAGTWYWLQSSDGSFHSIKYGRAGDLPVPGDYDGDGTTDQAIFRPAAQTWFHANRSMLGPFGLRFGISTDLPPGYLLQAR